MNAIDRKMEAAIRHLLDSQQLAVLATQRNGQPYTSLMAYAFTDDLEEVVVATGTSTRKHQNILTDSRVSLLVDNRSNAQEDFHEAIALTIVGSVQEVPDQEFLLYQELYMKRHPYLDSFVQAPSTVLLKIVVYHYLLVSRFQNVMEYHIRDEMDLFS